MRSALSPIYGRLPVAFTHGQGVWLWDTEGKRYLDGLSGIGVSCLGHAHPALVKAISEQAAKVIHTSNIYEVPLQEQLAQRITAISGMSEVFFANSGAEANEGAIKLARLYGHLKGIQVPTIITMDSSWHGRTLGTLAATGSEKARQGFEPLPAGFVQVTYNKLDAITEAAAQCPEVVAVLIEVLQGEGGIRPSDLSYLKALRKLCDERGWLLMIDEVQSGIGRTGKWLAHQWAEILPDVITLAKGLGGGVPIGAVAARGPAAGILKPGHHGTTFGGGPLVCAAALAVLDTLEQDNLLEHAHKVGDAMLARLQAGLDGLPGVTEVRGRGLMIGIELNRPCADLVRQALEAGLLINVTRDKVVRLLPPLIISEQEANELVDDVIKLIKTFLSSQ
ncbi:aspartate aminotransferase family protein [Orrella daihaiensis]|uniref:Acetylornithine aminotransferase n=1 Tax=Orrella daihaiensis TaxID=2782176 RepID=A0ABY4AJK9_9BURK|nr:aspartate aminotransferase family protein [Orrella daihaiensis]UOD49237.1 aspartate aminotransferase family protein [Orrella daihaiensis]